MTISMIISWLDMATLVVRFYSLSYVTEWVNKYVTLFDVFTNFICIAMMYRVFDDYYRKMCKPIDSLCKRCFRFIGIQPTILDMMVKSVSSATMMSSEDVRVNHNGSVLCVNVSAAAAGTDI